MATSSPCTIGPHRVAGVSPDFSRTWLSRYAGSKNPVRASSRPSGAITALMPVVPATTTYRSCSTARNRANASCWALIASSKVALLVGTASSWAPLRTDSRAARSKMTSQQVVTPIGMPAGVHHAVARAGHEVAGPVRVRRQMPEEAAPRQVLAERLHDLLVVPLAGSGGAVPHDHGVGRHGIVGAVAGRREHRADQDRRVDRVGGRRDLSSAASGLPDRVDVRGVLRPDHHRGLRCTARADVLGEPHRLANVVVEHRAPLRVELQAQSRHVALHRRDRDRRIVTRPQPRLGGRTARLSATASRTTTTQTPGTTTAGGAAWTLRVDAATTARPPTTMAVRLKPTSTTANDTSGAPPKCAMASSGLSLWLNPTTPQGNPPNGTVDFSHSANTQTPANHSGQPGSRRTATASSPKTAGKSASMVDSASHGAAPTNPLIHGNNGT